MCVRGRGDRDKVCERKRIKRGREERDEKIERRKREEIEITLEYQKPNILG